MFTAWGYEIDESSIPPLLDAEAFNKMTGGKYQNDALLVSQALGAASQAVRNACGWHVAPSLPCKARLTADGKLCKLPATYVSAVDNVTEGGVELSEGAYEWRNDGLMRRACFKNWAGGWNAVEVGYTAGFDAAAVPDLAQAVMQVAEGVLALPTGVTSESADGVSISYSSAASSVAAAMTDQMWAQLAPYRLVSSHAA